MNADGTNLAKTLNGADILAETHDAPEVAPSSRTYGGRHWWLWMGPREDGEMLPGYEIPIVEFYVGVPGMWKIRVTNLWDDYEIRPSNYPLLAWSNDHLDTFFSFIGRELTIVPDPDDLDDDGRTEAMVYGPIMVYKIPFHVMADPAGAPVPTEALEPAVDAAGAPLVDDSGEPILRTAIGAVVPHPGWSQDGCWSADGSTLLYQWFEVTYSDTGSQQYRVMLLRHTTGGAEAPYPLSDGSFVMVTPADPAPVLVGEDDRLTGALTGPQELGAQWSPDGGRIAFARFNGASSVGRDILTIPGNAAGLVGVQGTTTMLTGKNLGYSHPFWSPATGTQIVAREVDA
jgi:hypothetical protein